MIHYGEIVQSEIVIMANNVKKLDNNILFYFFVNCFMQFVHGIRVVCFHEIPFSNLNQTGQV